jgi:LPXTG-site transpeptidase (sortase) family protein
LAKGIAYLATKTTFMSEILEMYEIKEKQPMWLFIGTFVSAFLFVFGMITLFLLFMPVLTPFSHAQQVTATPAPQLPVSGDRDVPFLDVNSIPARNLYPELTSVDNTAPGNWIRIPSIGVNVPLDLAASLQDKDVLAALVSGAALYPNGILPGRLGNAFIAAHSTGEPWKGKYRFAFLKIDQIKPGDVINIDYNGTRYTYEVVGSKLVKPSADFTVQSDRPMPTVTLMACWPLWTINQRMLVTGELTHITKLTPTPS